MGPLRGGQDPRVDSYSGFFDNARRHDTGLAAWLRAHGVEALVVVGLATDYCVLHTVLDARALGFVTTVHLAACRGVDLSPGDIDRALERMRAAGAEIIFDDEGRCSA